MGGNGLPPRRRWHYSREYFLRQLRRAGSPADDILGEGLYILYCRLDDQLRGGGDDQHEGDTTEAFIRTIQGGGIESDTILRELFNLYRELHQMCLLL